MLRYILLGFLSYRPMTGYELKSIMDGSTMHFWHAYHSQIYTTLRRLDEEGLLESEVESDDDDKLNRRTYTITEAGRTTLKEWLDTPLEGMPQIKEDLLVRVFFSAGRDPDSVLDELRHQRQLHMKKLAHYQDLNSDHIHKEFTLSEAEKNRLSREALFWHATLEFGIAFETMYLAWLEKTAAIVAGLRD